MPHAIDYMKRKTSVPSGMNNADEAAGEGSASIRESLNACTEADVSALDRTVRRELAERLKGLAEWDGDVLRLTDPNGTRPCSWREAGRVIAADLPAGISNRQLAACRRWVEDSSSFGRGGEAPPDMRGGAWRGSSGGSSWWRRTTRTAARFTAPCTSPTKRTSNPCCARWRGRASTPPSRDPRRELDEQQPDRAALRQQEKQHHPHVPEVPQPPAHRRHLQFSAGQQANQRPATGHGGGERDARLRVRRLVEVRNNRQGGKDYVFEVEEI